MEKRRYFHYHNGRKVFEDTVVPRPINFIIKHEVTISMQQSTKFCLRRVKHDGKAFVSAQWDLVRKHNGEPKMLWKRELLEIQPDLGVEITSQKRYNKPVTRYIVADDGSIRKV